MSLANSRAATRGIVRLKTSVLFGILIAKCGADWGCVCNPQPILALCGSPQRQTTLGHVTNVLLWMLTTAATSHQVRWEVSSSSLFREAFSDHYFSFYPPVSPCLPLFVTIFTSHSHCHLHVSTHTLTLTHSHTHTVPRVSGVSCHAHPLSVEEIGA
jgi:hypothetical protein